MTVSDKFDMVGVLLTATAIVCLVSRMLIARVASRKESVSWGAAYIWPKSRWGVYLRRFECMAILCVGVMIIVRRFVEQTTT